MKKYLLYLFLCVSLAHCSSGVDVERVQQNIHSLGADFPSDIVIPDIEGMRGTAFIVSDAPALGVQAFDLDQLEPSSAFQGFDALATETTALLGYARKVSILSPTQAFFLGDQGLVSFNPTTGALLASQNLIQTLTLPEPLALSETVDDQDEISGDFNPSFASHLAVTGERLFVTMSNTRFKENFESYYVQGQVKVFELGAQGTLLEEVANLPLSLEGEPLFNPTALTVYQGRLLITISGVAKFTDVLTPQTPSYLVEIDPQTLTVTRSLNLGLVAATYTPLAITSEGLAFVGSAAYSHVYVVDLKNWKVLRGLESPILLSDLTQDYVTDLEVARDGSALFASSYNNSSVYTIDLDDPEFPVLPQSFDFHFAQNPEGTVTGAGPLALRQGRPRIDFSGADLWVLTSYPGTLGSVLTY